jgi:hypothetical protein
MTQPGYPPYGSPPGGYGPPPGGGGGGYGPPPGGGYGPPPGYGAVAIPPAPGGKKKSSLGLILGIVGGVVVLAGIGGVIAVLKLRSHGPGLPVDAKLLPVQTKQVGTRLIAATREPNEQVKKMYLASELGSTFCRPGEGDPADRIESIAIFGSKRAKDLFFDKKKLDSMGELIDCGAVVASNLDSPYQSYITFEDDQSKSRHVLTTKLKISELPDKAGFAKHGFGAFKGYCRTGDDAAPSGLGLGALGSSSGSTAPAAKDDGECKETSPSAFYKSGTWFLGDRTSLELMAKNLANPHEELGSGVSALKEAAEQTQGLPTVSLAGNPKSSKEYFLAPCSSAALQSAGSMTEFIEGCFPAKQEEQLLTEIDSRIRGAAYEQDGDYAKAGAVIGNMIFVARDDDSAKKLEKDVNEVVTDWKTHVSVHDAKLIKESKDKAVTRTQKKFAAVSETFFKAIRNAKVTRSGRTVRVAYDEKLSPEDLAEIKNADESTVEKRIATAQILEAIQAKKPVPQAPLAKLVGAKWATYLTGPVTANLTPPPKTPQSTSECERLQKQISRVKYADVAPPSRDIYFQLRWSSCKEGKTPSLSTTERICIGVVKTGAEFSACTAQQAAPSNEPPESEFGAK